MPPLRFNLNLFLVCIQLNSYGYNYFRLLEGVTNALQDMGANELNCQTSLLKLKATLLRAKGMIGISIQIYILLPSAPLSLIEIRRGKGDILEFHQAFTDLQKKISHLVDITPSASS